ncbi:hypothetical protein [Frankia sp. CiP3]|uniref:hypothetical protein n=1 Tax=Frankia sp. CiP3 TaxID=2880971 RepID=UPI001EF4361E|nr:hypothetical protein [Frankia sp. CiP3]
MAAAVLAAAGLVPVAGLLGRGFVGEVGLDGSVRPVHDLPDLLRALHGCGLRRVVVPTGCEPDAIPAGLVLEPVTDLHELAALLRRL